MKPAKLLLSVTVGNALFAAVAVGQPFLQITNINTRGSQVNLRLEPQPAIESYTFLTSSDLLSPFLGTPGFVLSPYIEPISPGITNYGYEWRGTNYASRAFYTAQATPMGSNALLSAIALNRLAYGPTPDELERIQSMGPQAWINEQLAMEGIAETMDYALVERTNTVIYDPATNWSFIVVTGKYTGANLYLFLTQPGEVYIDDLRVVEGLDISVGPNLVQNADFESPLSTGWILSGAASGSAIVPGVARSGSASLKLSSTLAGSTSANYVRQALVTSMTNNAPVAMSYWYLPSSQSSKLRVQLTGSGLISSAASLPAKPGWIYAQATGVASTTSRIHLYLSAAGECYVDDMSLVVGSVAGSGANLLQNGGFEMGSLTPWNAAGSVSASAIATNVARSGTASLRLSAMAAGSVNTTNSVYQNTATLVSGQTYTVSYWYLPAVAGAGLNVRLFGNLLVSLPDTDSTGRLYEHLNSGNGRIDDLRAWYCRHAVESPRQLLEVLSQFWENHFVTWYTKSYDYLGGFNYASGLRGRLAADWEYREMTKWRNAMLNPTCTFYDLLKISAESPAMIVYLDTVSSRGDGTRVANENYARELLELFTFGVDNGYDQDDIVQMSRAWTGWSVDILDAEDAADPLAPVSVTYYPNVNSTAKSNTVGIWSFVFKSANHGTNRGAIFPSRTVPARFGPPWAGRSYELSIPARTGTNGIQDGYDVIAHLANQPFTQEHICIKLCRLFVHDDFPNPTTDPTRPEYSFYDYTNPGRSAEAELVRQCMLAWENSNPKGQLKAVLSTIFNSALFRTQAAVSQKVKTPFEYVASSVRALRSSNTDGTFTSSTDGYAFATPLDRMGAMELFDREAPDGYPESGPPWISAGTLTERMRYVQAYATAVGTGRPSDAGNNVCSPVVLLKKKIPSSNWNNAEAVSTWFCSALYPGEGTANLALYRTAGVKFLNTSDDGVSSSPFSGLSNTSATYDTRVRGMIAMLMTLQRFHEQ